MKLPFTSSPKFELPELEPAANLAKLIAEHERWTAEIAKHERLLAARQDDERDLALNSNLEDAAQFRQLSDARLFIEICQNKLPAFAKRIEELEPQILAAADAVRAGMMRLADRIREAEEQVIFAPYLARFIEDKLVRERIAAEIKHHSSFGCRIARIAYSVAGSDLRERGVDAARRLVVAHKQLADELPGVIKHLSQAA